MGNYSEPEFNVREAQSKAVATAVLRLSSNLGYSSDVVFEGAIRGASAVMIESGLSAAEVAELLKNAGRLISTLDQDN